MIDVTMKVLSAFFETKRCWYARLIIALRPRALRWFSQQREKGASTAYWYKKAFVIHLCCVWL